MTNKKAPAGKAPKKGDPANQQPKEIKSLRDLIPDAVNANAGTVRGLAMLEDSVRTHGVADGITVGKDGGIIGGNKRAETMLDLGLDDVEPIVVQTDGSRPVIIQRTDIESGTPQAQALGIALNRTAQVSLAWDAANLNAIEQNGADLSPYFDPPEMDAIVAASVAAAEAAAAVAASVSSSAASAAPDPAAGAEGFEEFDESNTKTEHNCPKCGYEW